MIGKPKDYAQWRRERLQDAWLAEFNRRLRIIGKAIDEGGNPRWRLLLDAMQRASL